MCLYLQLLFLLQERRSILEVILSVVGLKKIFFITQSVQSLSPVGNSFGRHQCPVPEAGGLSIKNLKTSLVKASFLQFQLCQT